jgi:predicted short-subunit dehydrogenase-like oxidoreductase (DUF2520 family)
MSSSGFPVTFVTRGSRRSVGAVRVLSYGDQSLPHGTSIWILAVPDRLIAETARTLKDLGFLGPASIAGHLSGALPSSLLEEAAGPLYGRFSAHPLLAFPPADAVRPMPPGSTVLIEGDPTGELMAHALFGAAGAETCAIDPARKPLAHAAAVLAANLAATLIWSAADALKASGVSDSLVVSTRLMQSLLDNLGARPVAAVITGPIARCDPATVLANLQALDEYDTSLARLYRDLAERLANALHDAGTLPEDAWLMIRATLKN